MKLMLLTVLMAVLVAGVVGRSDDKKTMDEALDGIWLPTSAEFAGNPFPDEVKKSMRLEIKKGTFEASVGKVTDKGTLKVDTTSKPKRLETVSTDGPNKGRTFLAIYELKDDTLRVCYDVEGRAHPAEFKTKSGTQLFYIVYKRQKN